jgi:hypothetical protein
VADLILDADVVDGQTGRRYLSRYTQYADQSVAPYAAVASARAITLAQDPSHVLVQNLDTTNWRAALVTLNLGNTAGDLGITVLAAGQSQAVPLMVQQKDGTLLVQPSTRWHLDPATLGDPATLYVPILAELLTLQVFGSLPWAGQLTLLPAELPFVLPVAAVATPARGAYGSLDQFGTGGVLWYGPLLLQRVLFTNSGTAAVQVTFYDKATMPSFDSDPHIRDWVIGPGATTPLEMPAPGVPFAHGLALTFKDPIGGPDPTHGLFVSIEFR